jgi:outer membrane autotransporter protein
MAGGAGGEAGLWVRAVGDWTRQSQTSTYADLNRSYAFDSGYSLDVGGIVGGFDADRHDVLGKGGVLVLGIGGGYIGSTQNFHAGSARGDYNGGSLEITGAYLRQNFFVDGAVKADFLNATISAPGPRRSAPTAPRPTSPTPAPSLTPASAGDSGRASSSRW